MRDFLWEWVDEGHNSHLVSWEVVQRSVSQGGLEIGNLRIRNRGMMAKWLWRFHLERGSLWHKIILSKHGSHPFEWTMRDVKDTLQNPWNDISFELPTFYRFVSCFVGDGKDIFLGG